MAKIYKSVEELIGNTPLLELTKIEKETGATLLAKVEALNPGGSAKDRIAKRMVEDAEKAGILKEGATIIEPTSGNTGIGLALMAAARGYRAIIVMPDSMSMERRLLMTAFGAELVLTEGKQGMKGAVEKAEELAKEIPNSFIAGQFVNPSNPAAHYETTGPEIWADTDGKVDIFCCRHRYRRHNHRRRQISEGKEPCGADCRSRAGSLPPAVQGCCRPSWDSGGLAQTLYPMF